MLICVVTVPVCSAQTARSKPKPKHPTVSELLEMFAATQERTKSFIMKVETTKQGKGTLFNNVPMEMFSSSEVRFDGKRCSYRSFWTFS